MLIGSGKAGFLRKKKGEGKSRVSTRADEGKKNTGRNRLHPRELRLIRGSRSKRGGKGGFPLTAVRGKKEKGNPHLIFERGHLEGGEREKKPIRRPSGFMVPSRRGPWKRRRGKKTVLERSVQ